MNILWSLIVGLIAGALAKLIMPGRDPGGIWVTMALGVLGAIVANVLGTAVGWYGPDHSAGIIGSTIGAILILAIYRMIRGRRGAPPAVHP
jgi:uncharacterized membrane protein YeaQ/YmgE (transglycosylase-associated protein family)